MPLEERDIQGGALQPVAIVQTDSEDAIRVVGSSSEGAQVTLDFGDNEIHQGNTFIVSYLDESLGSGGTIEFIISAGTKISHAVFQAAVGGDGRLDFFEAPTAVVGGTAMTEENRRRDKPNDNLTTVVRDPTSIGGDGTPLQDIVIPGGTGGNAVGGAGGERDEWILDVNKDYLLRLTNISGGAQVASLEFEWYEVDF